ncbi:hypothetical protein PSACC_02717 [Paramicrosporidium saccamoebae]|uniref:Uncharacterized protein n=1 Tax=Paramicrosporidium saccamoebae TaxID=1246581 RepID=A0A2H9TI65_9FUNG|nr:hypothetical protein PSACC_02717 [Paramicrosporidium saccamoebae]
MWSQILFILPVVVASYISNVPNCRYGSTPELPVPVPTPNSRVPNLSGSRRSTRPYLSSNSMPRSEHGNTLNTIIPTTISSSTHSTSANSTVSNPIPRSTRSTRVSAVVPEAFMNTKSSACPYSRNLYTKNPPGYQRPSLSNAEYNQKLDAIDRNIMLIDTQLALAVTTDSGHMVDRQQELIHCLEFLCLSLVAASRHRRPTPPSAFKMAMVRKYMVVNPGDHLRNPETTQKYLRELLRLVNEGKAYLEPEEERYLRSWMRDEAKNGDFAPVQLDSAFSESDGFYAHYKSIPAGQRKLVLVRLPCNIPTSAMKDVSLRASKKRAMGEFEHDGGRYEVRCTGETPAAALVVPGKKGCHISIYTTSANFADSEFHEVWSAIRVKNDNAEEQGTELDFDGDVGGSEALMVQPKGLRTNLRATDFSTVINRKRKAASPAKKNKK